MIHRNKIEVRRKR